MALRLFNNTGGILALSSVTGLTLYKNTFRSFAYVFPALMNEISNLESGGYVMTDGTAELISEAQFLDLFNNGGLGGGGSGGGGSGGGGSGGGGGGSGGGSGGSTTITIADVVGLQTALDAKAALIALANYAHINGDNITLPDFRIAESVYSIAQVDALFAALPVAFPAATWFKTLAQSVDAAAALTSLSVYTKAEVDTLLANKLSATDLNLTTWGADWIKSTDANQAKVKLGLSVTPGNDLIKAKTAADLRTELGILTTAQTNALIATLRTEIQELRYALSGSYTTLPPTDPPDAGDAPFTLDDFNSIIEALNTLGFTI